MGLYQGNDLKKPTGGKRRRTYKVKRKALYGGHFTETKLSTEDEIVKDIVRGGNIKVRAKKVSKAVVISADGKTIKTEKILRVVETPSNKEFARRGIITKGAIIEVESGKARVISRPGQDGVVNAIIIEKK